MNHVLFWNCMAKNGTAIDPGGALIEAINKVSIGHRGCDAQKASITARGMTASAPAACLCVGSKRKKIEERKEARGKEEGKGGGNNADRSLLEAR